MAVFDQKMAAFDAGLDAMKAGSKEAERTFSPGNNYARQTKSPPQGRLGNCNGCGQPGHFKLNCPKLRARSELQAGNTGKVYMISKNDGEEKKIREEYGSCMDELITK